ncbi:NotI family restriction endonuclease [Magnetovibrio blakemorei]|uniref:Restriction endonuclease type II NotI domain-containing protein n=1 Tax=Magnetovibrio blakemorei TaxID=28181 RepID=A0A1E5Q458_9PROT|nr:NotI family restriction endonuclease [Magnetovibrio blakemorei]OEJ64080.1 hypothetical protein BEN30_01360 [Magnetovibrio blakemorei]
MALQIVEFFGFKPLDPASTSFVANKRCPFINDDCSKPDHGACSVCQTGGDPVICCPNRIYGNNYQFLQDIADDAFGIGCALIRPNKFKDALQQGSVRGNEVVVFGHRWGQELPLPTPGSRTLGFEGRSVGALSRKYYVDWILAKMNVDGSLCEMTATEVQTIDTTGSYRGQSETFMSGAQFTDKQGRSPGYSDAGLNWENVNKRILPQVIYKGHVLRREHKCTKGLYFVCPEQVYTRIRDRLGGELHHYPQGPGTITFRSYTVGPDVSAGNTRELVFAGQFTTTVDQVALAFTSPRNLPEMGVYEEAITKALSQ